MTECFYFEKKKSNFFLQKHRDASDTRDLWRSPFNSSLADTREQGVEQRLLLKLFSCLLAFVMREDNQGLLTIVSTEVPSMGQRSG